MHEKAPVFLIWRFFDFAGYQVPEAQMQQLILYCRHPNWGGNISKPD